MTLGYFQQDHMLSFSQLQQMILTGGAAGRLLIAAVLGGAVGLDREYHHKASGVRTNLLICFGAALFTFLSTVIAGESGSNKGQIASNIVQGIGFLGAGLILHNRNRVSGLTSAATVWAVASIGMACGAGLYVPAIFSTVLVVVALEAVGVLETRLNLKYYTMVYETRGKDATGMMEAILKAMDRARRRLSGVEHDVIGDVQRIAFPLAMTHRAHMEMLRVLQDEASINEVKAFRDVEDE
jgi:putative Mg2+ transporter-C (MgtC) family protein